MALLVANIVLIIVIFVDTHATEQRREKSEQLHELALQELAVEASGSGGGRGGGGGAGSRKGRFRFGSNFKFTRGPVEVEMVGGPAPGTPEVPLSAVWIDGGNTGMTEVRGRARVLSRLSLVPSHPLHHPTTTRPALLRPVPARPPIPTHPSLATRA